MLDKAGKYPFKSLSITNLDSPDWIVPESYDFVVCIGVFDFIADPQLLLRRIKACLRPQKHSRFGLTLPEDGEMNSFSR